MKLGWDDLLIQNLEQDLAIKCLGHWKSLLPQQRHRVVFLNRLGEWFLQLEDMSYCRISVLSGSLDQIARGDQEFSTLVNDPGWQTENLWSMKVFEWKQKGLNPGPSQVYAPVPHPRLAGGAISDNAMVMDLIVWQHIAAQTLGFA